MIAKAVSMVSDRNERFSVKWQGGGSLNRKAEEGEALLLDGGV